MAVFISYSHKDKAFVTKLAFNLIRDKTWVWIDEWEVAAGESLIERIQHLIQRASLLVAVFSKASVESVWCKREATAAIQRELEEKKVVLVPAVIENCELPLFVRDKRFADFRSDFDEGLATLRQAIAKFSNPYLGRIEGGEYHRDWSIDWGINNGRVVLRFTIVKHSAELPYSVLVQISIVASEEATSRYTRYERAGFEEFGQLVIIESILHGIRGHEFAVLLEDAHEKRNEIEVHDPNTGIGYRLTMESRRLGADTGMDILMHGEQELHWIAEMVRERVRPLTPEEQTRVGIIVQRNMRSRGPQ